MLKWMICLLAGLHWAAAAAATAPYGLIQLRPQFYAQHAAGPPLAGIARLPPQLRASPFRLLAAPYPVYHILPGAPAPTPPPPPTAMPTTTTTTTTTAAPRILSADGDTPAAGFMPEEFPRDLLAIAREKLGLRRLEEIPSVSELAELLGTRSADETIAAIRQLTDTEQGVALMRAYVESSDYTNNAAAANAAVGEDTAATDGEEGDEEEDDDGDEQPNEAPEDVDNDLMVVDDDPKQDSDYAEEEADRVPPMPATTTSTTTTTTPRPAGFFERMYGLLSVYNLWPAPALAAPRPAKAAPVRPPAHPQLQFVAQPPAPILVRSPLPYHYPIPLRPLARTSSSSTPPPPTTTERQTTTTTTTPAPPTSTAAPPTTTSTAPPPPPPAIHIQRPSAVAAPAVSVVPATPPPPSPSHLNTPRRGLPVEMQRLLKAANIAPQQLERFLQSKPKLAALAARVNAFPLVRDRDAHIERQLLQAVQRAIEQDEDLRQLLNATETLK